MRVHAQQRGGRPGQVAERALNGLLAPNRRVAVQDLGKPLGETQQPCSHFLFVVGARFCCVGAADANGDRHENEQDESRRDRRHTASLTRRGAQRRNRARLSGRVSRPLVGPAIESPRNYARTGRRLVCPNCEGTTGARYGMRSCSSFDQSFRFNSRRCQGWNAPASLAATSSTPPRPRLSQTTTSSR